MKHTSFLLFTFIFLLIFSQTADATKFKDWYAQYIEGKEAGKISACIAGMEYSNQDFTVRIYGEELDFLFFRKDFTLPYNTELGSLIFKIDQATFVLTGSTFPKKESEISSNARTLLIHPEKDDYGSIFNAIKNGNKFLISFPNGDSYPVSLSGSGAALNYAMECWGKRATGPWSNNPFQGNQQSNNPFKVL